MDEKKAYPTGTVTISAEEYRDLITECVEAKKEASRYASQFWAEQRAKDAVKADLDKATKKSDTLMAFILATDERASEYGLYFAELAKKEGAANA